MVPCAVKGCGFRFRDVEHAGMHLVMAACEPHLEWKAANLSSVHTLQNTQDLADETRRILCSLQEKQDGRSDGNR